MRSIGLGGVQGALLGRDGILAVAQYSPQLAVAAAMRMPFVPFCLSIANTFTDTTTLTSNMQTFQSNAQIGATGGNISSAIGLGGAPTLVQGVTFEIDSPNLNAGQSLKSINDFFYGLNSGIQATMMVDGAPKYPVAPFFTPLRGLCDMLNESWCQGWALQYNQSIVMQFQQTVAVPATPTTVTCIFRMWQPLDTAGILVQLSTVDAYNWLKSHGYDASSQDMPVNR